MTSHSTEFLSFELPARFYFNSAHIVIAPTLMYEDKPVSGGWYGRFSREGLSLVKVPREAWLEPGNYFLERIMRRDEAFSRYFFDLVKRMSSYADVLEERNVADLSSQRVSSLEEFFPEYRNTFCWVIGMGYPIDTALETAVREQSIDASMAPVYGQSFLQRERDDLYAIAQITDETEREKRLERHSLQYSWVENNYAGEHRPSLDSFRKRLGDVAPGQGVVYRESRPETILEWIGFLTFVRDERKRLNLIVNGMLDRYLQQQCERLGIAYGDALMLSIDEFEEQKKGQIIHFGDDRYLRTDSWGIHPLDDREIDIVFPEAVPITPDQDIRGMVACKGKVTGRVSVVLQPSDFPKVKSGDVLVASMTRPDFSPIFSLVGAIVTNEGGVTCHAAIVSRELGVPCIIGTKIATQVLHDGDLVEVDADHGVVRVLEKKV